MPTRLVNWCRRVVAWPWFDDIIMVLIFLSVALLAPEIALPYDDPLRRRIVLAQDLITGVFVVELVMRFLAARRRRRFFKEYWLDIVAVAAVLPVLRVLRIARFLRILRLLRMFRLASLLAGNSRILKILLQRRTAELFFTCALVVFAVTAGTLGLALFEHPHSGLESLVGAFWETVFSLISGEYSHDFPPSLGARLTLVFVELSGVTFFAILTGTVSAVMVEKLREGTVLHRMLLEDLENHILICGWNSGVETTLFELQMHPEFADRDIVVIAEREDLPDMPYLPARNRVQLLKEDFTRVEVLSRANVGKAAVALIVSDVAHGRTRQDADARTVLAALTIEKLNPAVHTCAELSNGMNEHHLRMGHVNEVIITQDLAGHLLAQAALSSAGARVLRELMRPTDQASLHPYPVPVEYAGKVFHEMLSEFREEFGAIPIAVQKADGTVEVNPAACRLDADDRLLCVGPIYRRRT